MCNNDIELAWAAGFFDGEGSVKATITVKSQSLTISIGQVDRFVLDRFRKAVGVGSVSGPYVTKGRNWKPVWTYTCGGSTKSILVCEQIFPYLSPMKQAQIVRALRTLREHIESRGSAKINRKYKNAIRDYQGILLEA